MPIQNNASTLEGWGYGGVRIFRTDKGGVPPSLSSMRMECVLTDQEQLALAILKTMPNK